MILDVQVIQAMMMILSPPCPYEFRTGQPDSSQSFSLWRHGSLITRDSLKQPCCQPLEIKVSQYIRYFQHPKDTKLYVHTYIHIRPSSDLITFYLRVKIHKSMDHIWPFDQVIVGLWMPDKHWGDTHSSNLRSEVTSEAVWRLTQLKANKMAFGGNMHRVKAANFKSEACYLWLWGLHKDIWKLNSQCFTAPPEKACTLL